MFLCVHLLRYFHFFSISVPQDSDHKLIEVKYFKEQTDNVQFYIIFCLYRLNVQESRGHSLEWSLILCTEISNFAKIRRWWSWWKGTFHIKQTTECSCKQSSLYFSIKCPMLLFSIISTHTFTRFQNYLYIFVILQMEISAFYHAVSDKLYLVRK